MERTVWTDERLDDFALAMREGFARVDRDLAEMRTEIRDLRTLMLQLWGTTMAGILVTLVAIVLTRS
jgi:hypothetical protein